MEGAGPGSLRSSWMVRDGRGKCLSLGLFPGLDLCLPGCVDQAEI